MEIIQKKSRYLFSFITEKDEPTKIVIKVGIDLEEATKELEKEYGDSIEFVRHPRKVYNPILDEDGI